MSLSKLVRQNDYAHEGKPTFAKTRHGPLVMVNNHSTQDFSNNIWSWDLDATPFLHANTSFAP